MQLLAKEFEQVYNDNYKFVLNFCRKRMHGVDDYVVDDIVQDVFMKIFLNLYRFDGRAKMRTWICSIALNTCRDYFRARKGVIQISLDNLIDSGEGQGNQRDLGNRILKRMWDEKETDLEISRNRATRITHVINVAYQELDSRSFKAFRLIHVDGLALKIVAKKIGVTYSNMRQINRRIINLLKASV